MSAVTQLSVEEQVELAHLIRESIVQISYEAGVGHIGSALSTADLLAVLYGGFIDIDPANPQAPDRDRFLLSKGHASAALYSVLALRGIAPKEELQRYGRPENALCLHPEANTIPGVEFSTGSLGHGLGVATGMALGLRTAAPNARVYVLMSDGELNEGSVWEAAMFASHHRLGNLTAIVDANALQATGPTDEVLSMAPLADKWRAFKWDVHEIDGHDIPKINETLQMANGRIDKPSIIIARTVKGKGIDFMEGEMTWHYFSMNDETYAKARAALER